MTPSEHHIEQYLVYQARKMGGECRKVKWIGRLGAPACIVMMPDKFVLGAPETPQWLTRASRTIWVEVKAPGVKPEDYQLREHERMRKMGQRGGGGGFHGGRERFVRMIFTLPVALGSHRWR